MLDDELQRRAAVLIESQSCVIADESPRITKDSVHLKGRTQRKVVPYIRYRKFVYV